MVCAALAWPLLAHADYTVVQVAPFTGNQAGAGKLIRQGADLVFRDVNDKGGIGGNKIRFISYDDGYKSDETVRQLKAAVADKPIAIVGLVGTGNVTAAIDSGVIDEIGAPVIGVRTGASSLREKPHPLVFHLRASYGAEVDKLVQVASTLGVSRFGVLYQNDAFGEDGFNQVKRVLAERKLTLAGSAIYEKNTTRVGPAVEVLLKGDPGALILISNTAATAAFAKAYREKGGIAQLFTLSVNNEREIVTEAGLDHAHGLGISQVVPFPSSGVLPMTRDYLALLKKYGGADAQPSVMSLEGYIYGRVLVEGLRRSKGKPESGGLAKALESGPFDLGGFVVNFTPGKHEGSHFVELTLIGRAGELVH
jgi:ABC-type branched-subunit amino acid transport system substrate-binding protein